MLSRTKQSCWELRHARIAMSEILEKPAPPFYPQNMKKQALCVASKPFAKSPSWSSSYLHRNQVAWCIQPKGVRPSPIRRIINFILSFDALEGHQTSIDPFKHEHLPMPFSFNKGTRFAKSRHVMACPVQSQEWKIQTFRLLIFARN